jgi:hypothetical protein
MRDPSVNVQAKAASRPTILLAATAALALSMLYFIVPVAATQPDPLHKVTICHRTNSTTNPYVIITVDEASVDGDNGNDNGKGDHLLEHLGPVWDANTVYPPPHNGDQWGDIIPPFYSDGVTPTGYPSLNWDAAGQALFANGCNFPGESVEESIEESAEEPVEESVAESVEQSVEESVAESVEESVAESVEESVAESAEQTVEAGTGTPDPEESQADTALGFAGSNPLPTIAFSLVLLASLAGLAFANVKGARARR